eukprot:TRINITY_DN6265_c0_g1_i2.p1 TRINITY_DN6265_c0_g1~~TRINITY_DN6265_c0_g1_i2.p1  ORF type:complete len:293 (+),score=74.85 TRINITY_DN6265_c0_g1_i2:64-879(+)
MLPLYVRCADTGAVLAVELPPSGTVADILDAVAEQGAAVPRNARLLFQGQELQRDSALCDAGVGAQSQLELAGGMHPMGWAACHPAMRIDGPVCHAAPDEGAGVEDDQGNALGSAEMTAGKHLWSLRIFDPEPGGLNCSVGVASDGVRIGRYLDTDKHACIFMDHGGSYVAGSVSGADIRAPEGQEEDHLWQDGDTVTLLLDLAPTQRTLTLFINGRRTQGDALVLPDSDVPLRAVFGSLNAACGAEIVPTGDGDWSEEAAGAVVYAPAAP